MNDTQLQLDESMEDFLDDFGDDLDNGILNVIHSKQTVCNIYSTVSTLTLRLFKYFIILHMDLSLFGVYRPISLSWLSYQGQNLV